MRLLLDTHVLLWWREASPRIGDEARREIATADDVFVSAASAWEVAIKVALGKLRIPGPLEAAVSDSGFGALPIAFSHAAAVTGLAAHHADPFDRMLIAQAVVEGLTIVTHDRRFAPYGVPIVWV
jgi:PIN domain nuclease of toxin-antitoxin system